MKRPGPTSLDLLERGGNNAEWGWQHAAEDPRACPKLARRWVNLRTGELGGLVSCKSIRCAACAPKEIARRVRRIAGAGPERFITLTDLPAEYQAARLEEKRIRQELRRRGYKLEWAVAHELTQSGLRHAHVLQKGSYIPQRVLAEITGRVCDIRRIKSATGAAGYALKEALRTVEYATKGSEYLDEHLSLNGGWLVRTTKGYFR